MPRDYEISRKAGDKMWTCKVTNSYDETHTNYFETERKCREHIYYTWENERDPMAKIRAEHWRDDLLEWLQADLEEGRIDSIVFNSYTWNINEIKRRNNE